MATFLVLDDSPTNLDLARNLFEPFGHRIVTAQTVKDAFTLARQILPDLILSDVHLPGEDGFVYIRAVKADPHLESIPFVFLSSTVWRDKDRAEGLALGAAKFIFRPIEPQALLREIEDCLRLRK